MSYEGTPVGIALRERPDVPSRQPHTAASWLAVTVVRPAWLWRRELSLGATFAALVMVGLGGILLDLSWLPLASGAVTVGMTSIAAGLPRWRRALLRWLRRGRIRRRWDVACRFSHDVETASARIPRIRHIEEYTAGKRLRVRMPKGTSYEDLDTAAEKIAVVLRARDVSVTRDPDTATYPWVDIMDRNPFRDPNNNPLALSSPLRDAASWSLWNPVPLGIDDIGSSRDISLPGRNILIGGEPEAGKFVAMSQILAGATLDPTSHIYGIDAKQVELSLWEPVMRGIVYNNIDAAIDILKSLVTEMDTRYEKLMVDGRRSVSSDMGWPLYLLAIDELRFFTSHTDKRPREEFNKLLIDVVARGRAAGIITGAATQRPSSDVVPTSLRDLFSYRWTLRCSTRDASDTILGSGWATEGYSASTIDTADRGLGYLLAEGGIPRLVKSAYLDDDAITSIVARGVTLRESYT